MASRFWVGGTGNWSDATNHWATTSGGSPGAGNLPTATDDVFFDSASHTTNYTVTINATTKVMRDITFAAPAAGNVTWAGSTSMNISGSMTLYAGLVRTYTGAITFNATSGTKTITSNGVILGSIINLNGSGGTFQLADDFNTTGTSFQPVAGTFDGNGHTFTMSGATATIAQAVTFYNLSIIPVSPAKTNTLTLAANITVSNLFTVSDGATVTNRVLVRSNTIGTPRTITAASISISNTDFRDITGAGAASWDMSAASGGSGDCGGNTMQALGTAAFTTADENFWIGGTGSWSDVNEWANSSGGSAATGRVPLPQDDVRFDANSFSAGSQTVTQNMPRAGKNIDWTGVTNTPTFTTSTNASVFGSLTLVSGMTLTASTQAYIFEGRGTHTITMATKTWAKALTFECFGGKYTLQDAFTSSSTINLSSGELDANDQNVTFDSFASNSSLTRVLTMGNGTWESVNGTSANLFLMATTGATVNPELSTIKFSGVIGGNKIFAGGSKTYNNFEYATTGAFNLTVSGSNTFNDFKIDASGAARSVLFTVGTTQTMSSMSRDAAGTNIITINSTTTGTHALVKSGGSTISLDYLNIQHSVATPSSTWYAGTHSTDNQAVATAGSGWIFTDPPAPSTRRVFIIA